MAAAEFEDVFMSDDMYTNHMEAGVDEVLDGLEAHTNMYECDTASVENTAIDAVMLDPTMYADHLNMGAGPALICHSICRAVLCNRAHVHLALMAP